MTVAHLKTFFREVIKVVAGGPAVGTPGSNRAAGLLQALDKLVDFAAEQAAAPSRDITAVPAAKRSAVVGANAPAVAEPDTAYFECYFYDEVTHAGSITKYHCGISVQADGSTVWKWFRSIVQ